MQRGCVFGRFYEGSWELEGKLETTSGDVRVFVRVELNC